MCSRYFGLVLVFVLIAAFMSRISCEQVEQITSEIDANDNNIENEIAYLLESENDLKNNPEYLKALKLALLRVGGREESEESQDSLDDEIKDEASYEKRAMPRMGRAMPRMGRAMPRMGRSMPRMGRAMPRMGRAMPRMGRHLPRMG